MPVIDMVESVPGAVKGAVMIASANRFEHYEIAGYGVAKALGFSDDATLLDDCIDEASDFDAELSKIAAGGWFGSGVNEAAMA
ncbi:ferritin-like domain-containing protein [bacterium]|nr:ferritin-like domain-containing protein [bacterium]